MGSLLSLHRLEIHFYQKVVIIILINMEDKLNSTLIWAHICAYMLTQVTCQVTWNYLDLILWFHKSWFLSSLWSIQNSLLHLFAMYWLMVQDCCQGCATLMCVNRAIVKLKMLRVDIQTISFNERTRGAARNFGPNEKKSHSWVLCRWKILILFYIKLHFNDIFDSLWEKTPVLQTSVNTKKIMKYISV